MAITIDTTVGGAAANSYATTAEIDAHAEETVWESDWTGKSAAEKSQLAVRAARALDTFAFRGRVNSDTQALQWPRTEVYRDSGAMWATDEIPGPVKTAQMHLAAWLASLAATVDPFKPATQTGNVKRSKLDVIETEYFAAPRPEGEVFLSDTIAPMLRRWGLLGAAGTVPLTR